MGNLLAEDDVPVKRNLLAKGDALFLSLSPFAEVDLFFSCVWFEIMISGRRLSREEKGKSISTDPTPTGGDSGDESPLEEFSLLHRDAMRDTDGMTLDQRLLVADAHRLFREERSVPVIAKEGGSPLRVDPGLEVPGEQAAPKEAAPRRKRKRLVQSTIPRSWIPELQQCRPTRFHPGGSFEELPALPPESLRNPYAEGQEWEKIVGTRSTHSSVREVLRVSGGVGVTYLIPNSQQRPWSPPVGYQCLYESYFQEDTKLWFPVPRLVTSYAFRRDVAISQFVNGSYRIAVALMMVAAEINISLSVRTFEELATSDEYAFAEPPKEDYRVLWNLRLVSHPNTIAYPEDFFEDAQALAATSHRRWPDLSREWTRRAQDRALRETYWLSNQVPVVVPKRKRLSLFTRKQQGLLNRARKMEGVPDLSALLKGQLRLLATKDKVPSSSAGADPVSAKTPLPVDPVKKKKTGKKRARDESASNEADVAADVENRSVSDPFEEPAPSGSLEKKKRRRKKRSAEDPHVAQDAVVDPSLGIQSEENPRDSSPLAASPGHDTISLQKGTAEDGGCPAKKKNAVGPPSSAQSAPQLGGSGGGNFSARGLPPNFRDRVNFSYDERTPLILNPPRCTELTRQIRGAPAGLPPIEELAFKELYTEVACSSKRNEANMNMLVAAYEGELRHTVVQLAAADKLARVRQLAIDRVKGELKEVKDKSIEDKEILREQFEKLEDKLKSSQFSKNRLSEENAVLRKKVADLEEQNASISAELASEGKRLRDSRVYEVTQERVRVLSAMIAKANVRFNNIRDRESRRGEFDLARNLYGAC
ncbi:Uncharacterized protein Rs2_14691 [Raphanus sativus]|nr:Uncharacterized protein Rs2_14691 [Raphanus sativus]